MEWCNDECIRLNHEYQQEEVLWNPKHAFYFSKIKKQDAGEKISKQLNKNPEEIKKKTLSLLGSFRREKAKGKKTMRTGTGRKDVYTSKWFAFEAFQFLLDRDDPRPTLNTDNLFCQGNAPFSIKYVANSSLISCAVIFDLRGIFLRGCNGWSFCLQCPSIKRPPSSLSKQPGGLNKYMKLTQNHFLFLYNRQIKEKKRVSDKCIEEAIEILKRPYPTLTTPDEWSVYGQHLANKLRKYTPHTSSIVQHYFNNILFEADMGKYDVDNRHNIVQQPQYSRFYTYSTPSATFSQSSPLSRPPLHYLQMNHFMSFIRQYLKLMLQQNHITTVLKLGQTHFVNIIL
ncbi:uncharacterized protein LOC132924773 [Rhopalosiphum padi]|uniref:uncharacterized protein LOC132924773 n=1 Tax=Rhopalosiphum padi TaxID=40932 RepID=UPI00298DCA2C|nr:uncharacterized protein LOC132924773 [Rhopalosiphum padi]